MALYHKYRPQIFADVVGQEHVVTTLSNEITDNALAHAYLFSGPRGVGKTTLARLVAKAINCPERKKSSAEPCNACSSCEEIATGRSIDVIEIDAASHTGVDNVRENIIENAQFKPTKSPYKIFIIDEVHMLSTSAFNALLKTLEEPPAHVIFILATTELQKLPETIISRCQRFTFKKIPYATMKEHLLSVAKEEKVKVDQAVLDRVINKSDGCARDALSLLDQLFSTGEKTITPEIASVVLPTSPVEETMAFLDACIHKQPAPGFAVLNTLVDAGANLMQFATDAVELLRGMMIFSISGHSPVLAIDISEEGKTKLESLSKEIVPGEMVRLTDLFMKRRLEIRTAPIPQLPLELLLLEWCYGGQTPPTLNMPAPSAGASVKTVLTPPPAAPEPAPKKAPETPPEINTAIVEPETKTVIERVKEFVSGEPVKSIEEIKSGWNAFVGTMEHVSPSLVFILKMAEVVKIDGNTVTIAVPYGFHRDKLMGKTCQRQIEQGLTDQFGTTIHIDVMVDEKGQQDVFSDAPSQEMIDLANALGGELVEGN